MRAGRRQIIDRIAKVSARQFYRDFFNEEAPDEVSYLNKDLGLSWKKINHKPKTKSKP